MTALTARRGWFGLLLVAVAGGCPEVEWRQACALAEESRDADAPGDEDAGPAPHALVPSISRYNPFGSEGDLRTHGQLLVGGDPGAFQMRGFDHRGVTFVDLGWGDPVAEAAPPRAHDPGDVYGDVGFEEARRRADQSDCWLLVRFGAGWSEPTRQLDEALNAPHVVEWVEQHAVAVAVDAEAEPDLARARHVTSVPTLVLYRDGEEWAASEGYVTNLDMLPWLVRAADAPPDPRERPDPSSLERSSTASAAKRASSPVWAAHARARQARLDGRHDDALQDMLWLWIEGEEQDPSYRGVRASFGARDMERLARVHPPALEAFDALRRQAEEAVLAGGADADTVRDWFVLTEVVAQEHRILAWYDSVRDAAGRLPPEYAHVTPRLVDLALEHGRRADAGRLIDDVDGRVALQLTAWPLPFRPVSFVHALSLDGDHEWQRLMREHFRDELVALHGTLLAAGRLEEAGRVADTLLAELDDVATRARLVEEALDVRVVLPTHEAWLREAERLDTVPHRRNPLDGSADPHPELRLLRSRLRMVKAAILDPVGMAWGPR